ncbi:3'-5' exoribonuclease domain-containing protein [Rhizohabitans arisaemae]|uniref:3'-5' exoribonuclease domain-containing protein n=1 Tax=Rhizohabitans arisaemae TaxID=2720610 RepID=UPI0024B2617D|nr:3'-5' exoribonuclease [Rhizohabitans arisaemae]
MKSEIYISADIEADGPIPGPYSMVSFGLSVAGSREGTRFIPSDPLAQTFYAELKPISENYVPEALAVSGLDRDRLIAEGQDPRQAMTAAASWIRLVGRERQPVFVAYPLAFDWMWMYWYFITFNESGSPFGHSRCLDIKTLYAAKADVPIGWATKRQMPEEIRSTYKHTHNALDDAVEQAELFQNIMRWKKISAAGGPARGPQRGNRSASPPSPGR